MRSLVVLCAAFAVCVAAPSDEGVAKKRSIGYVAYGAPAAVVEPLVETRAVYAPTVYATPTVYSTPTVYAAPAAVSHQSRVDIKSSPAVVATSPAVVASAPAVVAARTVVEPVSAVYNTPSVYYASAPAATVYAGGAAVSQQSRVDVKSSPAVVTEQVVQPSYIASAPVYASGPAVYAAHSVYSPSVYSLWK